MYTMEHGQTQQSTLSKIFLDQTNTRNTTKKVAASTEHSIKQSNVLENSIETEAVPK